MTSGTGGFDESNTIEFDPQWETGEYIWAAARWIANRAVEHIISDPSAPTSLGELYRFLDDRNRSLLDVDGLKTISHGQELVFLTLMAVAEDPRIRVVNDDDPNEIAFVAKIPAGE